MVETEVRMDMAFKERRNQEDIEKGKKKKMNMPFDRFPKQYLYDYQRSREKNIKH